MDTLRNAYRAIKASPLVSAVTILSLALGIGANTALFSILDSLLFKPLPVRAANELVVVDSVSPRDWYGLSYPVWREIRDRRVFERAFAWGTDRVGLSDGTETRFAEAIWASGTAFDVLGVQATSGRTFRVDDDRRGGGANGPVALISYRFWQRRFGGASDTIGRTLAIERGVFTIVGIMPREFFGLNVGSTFDLILPLETEPLLGRSRTRLDRPTWPWLYVMARLSTGQTPAGLSAALSGAQPEIREATMPAFNNTDDRDRYLRTAWVVTGAPNGVSAIRDRYAPAVLTLMAIVGVVLLVACANIATLMMGRLSARQHELSVRLALGASRGRLVRQLLAEALLLSALGAAFGLMFARSGSRLLVAQLSTWASTAFLDLSLDWRVLSVTAATTVTTAILFGTLPTYRSVRVPAAEMLKGHSSGGAGGAIAGFGGSLIVVQVALSLVLVIGAGLFLRSFVALAYRDIGFDRGRVLVAVVDGSRSATAVEERAALYERVRDAIGRVPGVESAAVSMATPLGSAGVRFTPDIGDPGNPRFAGRTVRILTNPVSPEWFNTFGTRLTAGRDFDSRDRPGSPDVVIVNEAFARRYFNEAAPLGRTVLRSVGQTRRRPMEIVGVVEDTAFTNVREAIEPMLYTPLAQPLDEKMMTVLPSISVSVRSVDGLAPGQLTGGVAAAIAATDRNLTVTFQTVTEQLSHFYIRERVLAALSVFFGVFALVLAATGVYATISHSIDVRVPEIGIRMALGASPVSILRLILARVVSLTTIGLIAGTLFAIWIGRLVRTLLYGIDANDPLTYAWVILMLTLVTAAAGWLPTRRAARIEPAAVLRRP